MAAEAGGESDRRCFAPQHGARPAVANATAGCGPVCRCHAADVYATGVASAAPPALLISSGSISDTATFVPPSPSSPSQAIPT